MIGPPVDGMDMARAVAADIQATCREFHVKTTLKSFSCQQLPRISGTCLQQSLRYPPVRLFTTKPDPLLVLRTVAAKVFALVVYSVQ